MSFDGEFIVKFIAESAGNGKQPIEAAKEEISKIDISLLEAEKLKLRRMKLISVLEHFGDESHKRRRGVCIPASDDIDTSSDEFSSLQERIKRAISEKGPLNVNELIRTVGSYDEDFLIMRAVKLLGEREVISRDDNGRVQPGKNW